jgi:WD40 repeat protein
MLHSLPDGALVKTFGGTSAYPESIALTPDLRLLASGNGDGTILLWSLPDGTLLKTITGHSDWVLSTAISPDGRMLASSSSDATIKLWSLPDGKQLPVCLMDPDAIGPAVTGARYTKDGVAYTVPCGTPLPAGAVCTCNCVPGCTCVTAGPGCGTVYWYPN